MLTKLREKIKPVMDAIAAGSAKLIPSPTGWTFIGFLVSILAAYLYSSHFAIPAGVSVLLSGFMDMLDGAVARKLGKVTARGGFLDSNLDRAGEAAIYLGLILSNDIIALYAATAMALSLLVSYARSRAEASGLKAEGVGYGERAERLIILAVASFVGFLNYGIILIIILAGITFVQRLYVYGSKL
ncbi:MAG: CDP-alcohol phosphatidyltransferase family protein [Conexivisphaerales archaeon]